MRLRMKGALIWAVGVVLLAAGFSASQTRGPRPNPKLVVVLVVDQMRADYVEKFSQQWTGGLRRLVEHGAWFRQAAYPYFSTHTCAGHATIATGTFPATHGVIDNQWWDRDLGRTVTCTEDAQAHAVSYGAEVKGGDSAARLQVPTFAEELRVQTGRATRVLTFALKARSAIMLAGHRADAVTWHDERTGAWVTSSAYAIARVPFVEDFVKTHPVDTDFGKPWNRSLPQNAYLYEEAAFGATPPEGWSAKFPHVLKSGDKPDAGFYKLWEESPLADAYLGRMAEAAVDDLHLGKGPGVDFLGVGFSTLDLVGHDFGPFSHEVQDVLVRLDATIGSLLTHLDSAVGVENYVVALTADHGVAPIPEHMVQMGFDAGRVLNTRVKDRAQKALEQVLGPGEHVVQMDGAEMYLARGLFQKLVNNQPAMLAAVEAIHSVPGVERVLRRGQLMARQPTEDPLLNAARLSYFPTRSGDFLVVPRPYWLMISVSRALPSGRATNHGTSYAYDTRVPVILMGRNIRVGEYLSAATPADIAPTLALLCGVTLARTDGRVLTEALLGASAAPAAKAAPPKR